MPVGCATACRSAAETSAMRRCSWGAGGPFLRGSIELGSSDQYLHATCCANLGSAFRCCRCVRLRPFLHKTEVMHEHRRRQPTKRGPHVQNHFSSETSFVLHALISTCCGHRGYASHSCCSGHRSPHRKHCACGDGLSGDLASLWAARVALSGHDQLRNPLPVLPHTLCVT